MDITGIFTEHEPSLILNHPKRSLIMSFIGLSTCKVFHSVMEGIILPNHRHLIRNRKYSLQEFLPQYTKVQAHPS